MPCTCYISVFSTVDNLDEDLFANVRIQPWRRYQFYMSAINELGESDLSEAVSEAQCVTPATVPSRNPNGVCSSLRQPKQLVITWEVTSIELQSLHRMAAITSQWWRRLVNAYKVKAGMMCFVLPKGTVFYAANTSYLPSPRKRSPHGATTD